MPYLAARGCLIAAFLAFPIELHGQESAPEGTAPIEEGQGITFDAPTPQESRQEQPADEQQPTTSTSQSVLPIQKQRPAEPTCDARCQAAEQREKDDLAAQRSMAASTEDLVGLTYWQIGIGAVGALLLVGTLLLMIQANKAAIRAAKSAKTSAEAAQAAVAVAQDTAKHELRAYVVVELLKLDRYRNASVLGKKGDWFSIRAQFKNVGKTPAQDVRCQIRMDILPPGGQPTNATVTQTKTTGITLNPGIEFTTDRRFIDMEQAIKCFSGDISIFFVSMIEYDDVFERPQTTETCHFLQLYREPTEVLDVRPEEFVEMFAFTSCKQGNKST